MLSFKRFGSKLEQTAWPLGVLIAMSDLFPGCTPFWKFAGVQLT